MRSFIICTPHQTGLFFWVIKSIKMIWGYVVEKGDMRNTYKILAGNPERKRIFRSSGRKVTQLKKYHFAEEAI
jgi:hypothetical protein